MVAFLRFYGRRKKMEEIIKYFPIYIQNLIRSIIAQNPEISICENVQEIRIRADRPLILKLRQGDVLLEYIVTSQDILQTVERLCENSIYAYKNQICEGFITIPGGHRVGITGSCVIENGKIINLKYISSLNIRVARQVLNCSNKIIKDIINQEENTIYNTMLVSPPGKGKTTMLRDIIRKISNGMPDIKFAPKTCGIVDERGEIASCFKGVPQNDVGMRTDIIENVSKSQGLQMLIRSMSPEVVACDEIGTAEDVQAIRQTMCAGVKGIFTCHGKTAEDIKKNKAISELIESKIIEKIIFI